MTEEVVVVVVVAVAVAAAVASVEFAVVAVPVGHLTDGSIIYQNKTVDFYSH